MEIENAEIVVLHYSRKAKSSLLCSRPLSLPFCSSFHSGEFILKGTPFGRFPPLPPPPPSHFSHLPDDWCTKPWISPAPMRHPPSLASEGGRERGREGEAGNAITIALLSSSPSSRSLTAAAADCTNRKPHPQCWIAQVFLRIFNKRWTFLSKLYVHLSK